MFSQNQAQQQFGVNPDLQALLNVASMVTPDRKPTVAAQVAQVAQSQAQPQEPSMGGMQDAAQNFQSSAPSVMQNMQQQQMAQMLRQASQQKPSGIESLPAQNMQGMRRMAQGGVIGYQEGGSARTYGYAPDYEDARKMGIDLSPYDSPEVRRQKLERLQRMREFEQQRQSFGEIPTEASVARDAAIQAAYASGNRDKDVIRPVQPGRMAAPPMAASTEGRRLAEAINKPTQFNLDPNNTEALNALKRAMQMVGGPERQDLQNKIAELESMSRASAPQQRPEAAPPVGIAALPAAPTFAGAMQEVDRAMPGSGTEQNRAELMRLQEMRRARPDTGQMTTRALEQEGGVAAALKAKLDESARERGAMSWLMGGAARGASARGYERFRTSEDQREMLHAQENTIRVAKIEAIKEANEARRIGDQESYVNALNKISELDRADKQVKATLAANIYGTQASIRAQDVQIRGQDMSAAAAEASRRASEEMKSLPTFEQQNAKRAMEDWMSKNPGSTFSDAWEWYRGVDKGFAQRAEGLREKNEIARRKLLESDMMYGMTRRAYINETDPAKKAEAFRKMKEIERLSGIIDDTTAVPAGASNDPLGLRK